MDRSWIRIVLTVMLLARGGALAAAAENPTPTPAPTPKGESTLSDVAGKIELDKNAAGAKGPIVISDENLAKYAGKGHVTEVTTKGPQQNKRGLADVTGTGAQVEGEVPGYAENQEKKQYWQGLYSQQIALVNQIREQIDLLDYEIPGLWRDFYSWDDPAYRDGVIKPKLDKALAQRQKLEVDMQNAVAKLGKIEQNARKDGGQPGWFRSLGKLPTPKPTEGIMPP